MSKALERLAQRSGELEEQADAITAEFVSLIQALLRVAEAALLLRRDVVGVSTEVLLADLDQALAALDGDSNDA